MLMMQKLNSISGAVKRTQPQASRTLLFANK